MSYRQRGIYDDGEQYAEQYPNDERHDNDEYPPYPPDEEGEGEDGVLTQDAMNRGEQWPDGPWVGWGDNREDEDELGPDDPGFLIDGVGFADPGGTSALRRETPENPRNLPCPECGAPNRLTPLDVQAGYRCDSCADLAEQGF